MRWFAWTLPCSLHPSVKSSIDPVNNSAFLHISIHSNLFNKSGPQWSMWPNLKYVAWFDIKTICHLSWHPQHQPLNRFKCHQCIFRVLLLYRLFWNRLIKRTVNPVTNSELYVWNIILHVAVSSAELILWQIALAALSIRLVIMSKP